MAEANLEGAGNPEEVVGSWRRWRFGAGYLGTICIYNTYALYLG